MVIRNVNRLAQSSVLASCLVPNLMAGYIKAELSRGCGGKVEIWVSRTWGNGDMQQALRCTITICVYPSLNAPYFINILSHLAHVKLKVFIWLSIKEGRTKIGECLWSFSLILIIFIGCQELIPFKKLFTGNSISKNYQILAFRVGQLATGSSCTGISDSYLSDMDIMLMDILKNFSLTGTREVLLLMKC